MQCSIESVNMSSTRFFNSFCLITIPIERSIERQWNIHASELISINLQVKEFSVKKLLWGTS